MDWWIAWMLYGSSGPCPGMIVTIVIDCNAFKHVGRALGSCDLGRFLEKELENQPQNHGVTIDFPHEP